MTTINLRDYYPFYTTDCFIDVSDEVAEAFNEAERSETAYRRRMFRHKAHYSLDAGDGIENEALFRPLTPSEIYECELTSEQINEALKSLPDKQRQRVYAHYVLGISQSEIAKAEGVSESAISITIDRGLKHLEKFLKNFSQTL